MSNYKIITDDQALRHFVAWLPELTESETYYVSLFARGRYAEPHLKIDKLQCKRFTARKESLVDKIRQLEISVDGYVLKGIKAPQETLALYISVNPRDMVKATKTR